MEELLMDISNNYYDLRGLRIYGLEKNKNEAKISKKLRQFDQRILLIYSVGIFVIGTFLSLVISEIPIISFIGTIFLIIGILGFINLLILAVKIYEKKDIANTFLAKLINLNSKEQAYIEKDAELNVLVSSRVEYDKKLKKIVTPRKTSIPQQYRNEYTLIWLFVYLTSNRANNLGEAINLFEQEEHQARLEKKDTRPIRNLDHVLEIMADWTDDGDVNLRGTTL